MATTTPNNGWPVPTSTDLVTNGATAIESLGDAIDAAVGSGLQSWTSWSPTLSGGWANGNGVWTASYAQLGQIVIARGSFVVGSTTTKGSVMTISLPVNAATGTATTTNIGLANATVGGSTVQQLSGFLTSATAFQMFVLNTAGTYLTRASVTSTTPATWATSDNINFQVIYEAA